VIADNSPEWKWLQDEPGANRGGLRTYRLKDQNTRRAPPELSLNFGDGAAGQAAAVMG